MCTISAQYYDWGYELKLRIDDFQTPLCHVNFYKIKLTVKLTSNDCVSHNAKVLPFLLQFQ